MNPKYLIVGAFASLALIVGAMTAAYFALGGRAAGNLADADYTPTARWVAPGVDPNVAQFELTQGSRASSGVDADQAAQHLVHTRYNDLMPCYAKALEHDDVEGRLDLRFGVQPSGEVALVEVTGSELQDPDMEACVVEIARSWRLPPTGREIMMKFDADFEFRYE